MQHQTNFEVTDLTDRIKVMANRYDQAGDLFTFKGGKLKTVTLDIEENTNRLVPSSEWGGVAPNNNSKKRKTVTFTIPHTSLTDYLAYSDIMGVRAFGSNELEAADTIKNDKLANMKLAIDQTMAWRKFGALKGIVYDADGATELANLYTSFGITKKTVNFALGTAGTDVRAKCMEVVRHMEDNLFGEVMTRAHVKVSPEFFDLLVSHASVKAAFANYAEAAQRIGGDMRKGFSFGGLTFEEHRGVVDGKRFIASGAGHAYPIGTFNTFGSFGAPADFGDTVNTLALPYYAREKVVDFNRGVELLVQSNILPICMRPNLLVEVTATA